MRNQRFSKLLQTVNPVSFCDGKQIFLDFMTENVIHNQGLLVVAPSGSGKTYFVNHQSEPHWIDGDRLWIATGAHLDRAWWTEGTKVINEVQQRSDIISNYAKKLGLWVIGTDCYWLVPDAIVLPDWEIQKANILEREMYHYDGGAKSTDHNQVLAHRDYLSKLAERKNIPVFKTILEMDSYFKERISNKGD